MQEQANAFKVLLEMWGVTAHYTTPDNQHGTIRVFWHEADITQTPTRKNANAQLINQQSCIYAAVDALAPLPAGTLITLKNTTYRMQQPIKTRCIAMAPIVFNSKEAPANDFGNFLNERIYSTN
ncbi:hypothetical protein [Spartinivicinus ruber]|uniref:hypothetical protein n=1 Tax=Spartinivicinus ruber TaxID=2683272 RepID=UPI0013D43AFE|nr:hypothetical protein [Spartinivicinus ruber]